MRVFGVVGVRQFSYRQTRHTASSLTLLSVIKRLKHILFGPQTGKRARQTFRSSVPPIRYYYRTIPRRLRRGGLRPGQGVHKGRLITPRALFNVRVRMYMYADRSTPPRPARRSNPVVRGPTLVSSRLQFYARTSVHICIYLYIYVYTVHHTRIHMCTRDNVSENYVTVM